MRLHCYRCGKVVSSEVPDGTVVRAWIECPECIEESSSIGYVAPDVMGCTGDEGE